MSSTTLIKIFTERYRHVLGRILHNEDGRYQELQKLVYLVYHDAATSPEQEAKCLLEVLKTDGPVCPLYYTIVGRPDWQEVSSAIFPDTQRQRRPPFGLPLHGPHRFGKLPNQANHKKAPSVSKRS